MEQSQFECNAIALLRKELRRLENEFTYKEKLLKAEKERLERLTSQLLLTKQQIDFFIQETERAIEGLKKTSLSFNKDLCSELIRLKNPSSAIVNLSEKMLVIFNRKERSWRSFKSLAKNFTNFSNLMINISPELISEEQLNEILPMWKTQETILSKVSQISKGAGILAEWIGFVVEFKLKQETLLASKKKIPDLEGKIKIQMSAIAETDGKMQTVQEKIKELKEKLQKSIRIEEDKDRINSSDMSIISIKSTHMKVESPSHVLFSPHFYQKDDFPNFGSAQLYGDIFVSRFGEEGEMEIKYEGENELIGCCRTRFFCF